MHPIETRVRIVRIPRLKLLLFEKTSSFFEFIDIHCWPYTNHTCKVTELEIELQMAPK